MIKAEPALQGSNVVIEVDFEYPSFVTPTNRNKIMALELTAILEAIQHDYDEQIVLDAIQIHMEHIKSSN